MITEQSLLGFSSKLLRAECLAAVKLHDLSSTKNQYIYFIIIEAENLFYKPAVQWLSGWFRKASELNVKLYHSINHLSQMVLWWGRWAALLPAAMRCSVLYSLSKTQINHFEFRSPLNERHTLHTVLVFRVPAWAAQFWSLNCFRYPKMIIC